jgi:hypothetical protein
MQLINTLNFLFLSEFGDTHYSIEKSGHRAGLLSEANRKAMNESFVLTVNPEILTQDLFEAAAGKDHCPYARSALNYAAKYVISEFYQGKYDYVVLDHLPIFIVDAFAKSLWDKYEIKSAVSGLIGSGNILMSYYPHRRILI